MPKTNSTAPKECTVHTWMSTTADGWRLCSGCKAVQTRVNGQWITARRQESIARRKRSVQSHIDTCPLKHEKSHKVREGFYADHWKADSNIQMYWGR